MAAPGSPRTRLGRRIWAKHCYEDAQKNKFRGNEKSIEIIGLPSAYFTHITTDSVPGSLTQTTFDTTSRADSAQILLTNSTGASKVIIAAWIRGKPVLRLSSTKASDTASALKLRNVGVNVPSNGGFLHDKFVDYERIAQDGDITFETGNNFVVTANQVNKLADYYWKLNRTKKHVYTLSLVGFQTWYEPGEWYTLQIGSAGEEEYVDSTVECFDVRCSISAGDAPTTTVSFREVEENWKFDSNEVARMIAAGGFSRRPESNVVTVAAQYYSGYADYYCDGTNDQEEINKAVNYLVGGGQIKLTRGDYNLTTSVTLTSNISLIGDGNGTVLNGNATGMIVVSCTGQATAYKENVCISNVRFNLITSIVGANFISYNYVKSGIISGISATTINGTVIGMQDCQNVQIINNNLDVGTATAQYFATGIDVHNDFTSAGSNIVQGNIIRNLKGTANAIGITIGSSVSTKNNQVINNLIDHLETPTSTGVVYGIYVNASSTAVISNSITNCHGHSSLADVQAIYIDTGSTDTLLQNNYCYNNGKDTGLENKYANNLLDNGINTQSAG